MVDVLSIAFVLLYHLKILQRIFNRYFFWAFRLSAILRFWLIIVLSFYNSTLSLYLCNIQIRYLHPIIMLCNILLYLLISSLSTLRGVWTINILSRYVSIPLKECTSAFFSFSFLTPWSQFFCIFNFMFQPCFIYESNHI